MIIRNICTLYIIKGPHDIFYIYTKETKWNTTVNRALTVNQLLFVASLFRAVLEINYQTRSDITPIWQSLVCSEKYTCWRGSHDFHKYTLYILLFFHVSQILRKMGKICSIFDLHQSFLAILKVSYRKNYKIWFLHIKYFAIWKRLQKREN